MFSRDVFDRDRYDRMQSLEWDLPSEACSIPVEQVTEMTTEGGYATPKIDVGGIS